MINKNIFVRADSSDGDRNGTDWYNAYELLQDALDDAMSQTDNTNINIYCDEDVYLFNNFTINHDSINIYGGNVIEDNNLIISGYNEVSSVSSFKTKILMYGDIYGYSGVFSSTGIRYISMYSGITYNGEEDSDIIMRNVNLSLYNGLSTSGGSILENVNVRSSTLLPTDLYGFDLLYSGDFDFSSPISGTYFLHTYVKDTFISDSNIYGFDNGIVFDGNENTLCEIDGVTIKQSSKAIVYNGNSNYISGVMNINNTLIYKSDVGLYVKDVGTSGYLTVNVDYSTFDTPYSLVVSPLISGTINIQNCIMSGNIVGADNLMYITSNHSLFDILPSGNTFVPGTGIIYGNPMFINKDIGDYSVGIASDINTVSSDALNAGFIRYDKSEYGTELAGFKVSDTSVKGQEAFLYKLGDTIVWSDEGKEIRMAEFTKQNPALDFTYNYTTTVPLYNKTTIPSLSRIENDKDWTYDWNIVTFSGPGIENETKIVPKSVIDITDVIVNNDGYTSKDNIGVKAYKRIEKRGVAFDYNLSNRTTKIIWSLDGDHNLTKTNMWTGDVLARYPLLPPPHPSGIKLFVKIDGVIPVGENKYAIEDDINTVINSVNDNATFEWFSPDKDRKWDLKGILAHKGLLYITASWADNDKTTPYLLVYPSRGYHEDYQNVTPMKLELHPDNNDPRGITVYEDGSILISNYDVTEEDGVNNVKIFHYKPCFDYALKERSSIDTKLVLREAYSEVTLEPANEEADI